MSGDITPKEFLHLSGAQAQIRDPKRSDLSPKPRTQAVQTIAGVDLFENCVRTNVALTQHFPIFYGQANSRLVQQSSAACYSTRRRQQKTQNSAQVSLPATPIIPPLFSFSHFELVHKKNTLI